MEVAAFICLITLSDVPNYNIMCLELAKITFSGFTVKQPNRNEKFSL